MMLDLLLQRLKVPVPNGELVDRGFLSQSKWTTIRGLKATERRPTTFSLSAFHIPLVGQLKREISMTNLVTLNPKKSPLFPGG